MNHLCSSGYDTTQRQQSPVTKYSLKIPSLYMLQHPTHHVSYGGPFKTYCNVDDKALLGNDQASEA
jgi:hypothetical protein